MANKPKIKQKMADKNMIEGEHIDHREFWLPNLELYRNIPDLGKGGFEKYIRSVIDLKDIFTLNSPLIKCIDEGTQDGVHAAGSLILVSDNEALEYIKKSGATGITSHEGCGATRIAYCHAHGIAQAEEVDPVLVDRFAMESSQRLANLARASGIQNFYFDPTQNHIRAQMMDRPSFHDATAVYVDFTGQLNNSKIQKLNDYHLQKYGHLLLPKGFVVSAAYHTLENTQKEVAIAISIALGNHGFYEHFTAEYPFMIIAVESPEGSFYSRIQPELDTLVSENEGRVVVDKFTAPVLAKTLPLLVSTHS